MGKGCNRLSLKMKQRKAWRSKKIKLRAKIAAGSGGAGHTAAHKAPTTAPATTVKTRGVKKP